MKRSILALAAIASTLATITSASAMGRGRVVEGPKNTVATVLSAIQNDKVESVSQYLGGKAYEQYGTARGASELKSRLADAGSLKMSKKLVSSNEGLGLRTYSVRVTASDSDQALDVTVDCRVSVAVMRQCTAEGPIFNPSETYGPYPRGQHEVCRPVSSETEACQVTEISVSN